MNGIGAVVKVVDSHLCGWSSIPGKKAAVFFIVSLRKVLSLCFMCSDQHVKYWMPREFPLTGSLLLDYHVKQYIHTYTYINVCKKFFNVKAMIANYKVSYRYRTLLGR